MIFSTRFTIDRRNQRLIADASDLPAALFERIYPDSCDEGLRVESARTGKVSTWAVAQYIRNDGDLLLWVLYPTPETLRAQPELNGWDMKIYND